MLTMALNYLVLLMLSLVSRVHSHASRAGINSACETMTPGHGAAAQVSSSPYYVDVVPNYYRPGQTVTENWNKEYFPSLLYGCYSSTRTLNVTLLYGLYSNGILTCTIARPISGQGNRYDASNYWTFFFAKVNGKIHIYYHEGDKYISRENISAYSYSDVLTTQTEEDGVNADSADSLMHIGYLKLVFISAVVIYYLFN